MKSEVPTTKTVIILISMISATGLLALVIAGTFLLTGRAQDVPILAALAAIVQLPVSLLASILFARFNFTTDSSGGRLSDPKNFSEDNGNFNRRNQAGFNSDRSVFVIGDVRSPSSVRIDEKGVYVGGPDIREHSPDRSTLDL